MKKIGIAGLIVVALSGVFYEKEIYEFFKGDATDTSDQKLQAENKYSKTLLEYYKAFHLTVVSNDCYIDNVSQTAELKSEMSKIEFQNSYFTSIPVLYYCVNKGGDQDLLGGHEIYMANVIFKDRYAGNLGDAKQAEFKGVLKTIRKHIHDLNGDKGFEQGYRDYDMISPYTFAKGDISFNSQDIELLKKYSK